MYGIHRKAFTTFLQSIYEKVSKVAAMLALIKIINIISGYAMQKRYVAVHTWIFALGITVLDLRKHFIQMLVMMIKNWC